jgi:peptidoglycan/xylan/chitin deacetylase (PgdA/CDA1 family)
VTGELEAHAAALRFGRFLRVVNFHNTPRSSAARIERQLAPYARAFAPVTIAAVDALFETGRWPHDRPGVLIALYEGYRSNIETALPVIERLGLVAWLFLPTAWLTVPVAEQAAFADAHEIGLVPGEPREERLAATWDEIRAASGRHVIAAHTGTHAAQAAIVGDEDVEREIRGPRRAIEQATGRVPLAFAWLYGRPSGERPAIDDALRASGYRYVVSNTRLQRIG